MRLSVIISTYNAPQWLEKVIWGYVAQSHQDFELLIADDGSTEETAVCIERLQREVGFDIQHIWHEHKGFRKCTILNKAIAASANEYLVFSDGDCIPRWNFLATHAALFRVEIRSHHEHRCRHRQFPEDRPCVMVNAVETVIKGNDKHTRGQWLA